MSDDIPLEIQAEIIKRLPVKFLIRSRSVSKSWKFLIDSPDFIAQYSLQHTELLHLLVRYADFVDRDPKFVSIIDDDASLKHSIPVAVPPFLAKILKYFTVIGNSHGLLCLFRAYRVGRYNPFYRKHMAILWNISIRKTVGVVVPNMGFGIFKTILGFGVCRVTSDPKITKITHINSWEYMENISCIPWQVEIFTLSIGVWKSLYNNLPRKSIEFDSNSEVIDGVLFWLVKEWTSETSFYNLIISFDITSEEFREVKLPDNLARIQYEENLYISKIRKSLVVIQHDRNDRIFDVWMMEDGIPESFTKLYTIDSPHAYVDLHLVVGFRKSREPIIEIVEYTSSGSSLVVYEPCSNHINKLGISAYEYNVYPYIETLLLLNQPDFTVYNKGKRNILKWKEGKSGVKACFV